MKKYIKIIIIFLFFISFRTFNLSAKAVSPGYSNWSTTKTGKQGEKTAVQYGRRLPKTWSSWSTTIPSSKHQKSRTGETKYYSYNGSGHYWDNTSAKELFTWNFGSKVNVIYFYGDVDTYVDKSYTNYTGPPLYLYCDGTLISSISFHDHLSNYNPSVNCNCTLLTLRMGEGGGSGRNKTSIVGSWATIKQTEYSYVTSWKDGQDWRFNTPYEIKYGEQSQIQATRNVYSYPLTYSINYVLDGGTPNGTLKTSYTVLDEFNLPSVYKKGYNFIGFYNSAGTKYTKINKGTYGNLTLYAKYERKSPTIYIGTTYFDEENRQVSIKDLIKSCNGKANDELDGDITNNIKVDYIKYLKSGNTVSNPTSLDISKAQEVEISFSIKNSGNKQAAVTKKFYILAKEEIDDYIEDDINIYTRYINEKYKDSLDEDSIWRREDYQELLNNTFERMRKEG